MKKKEFVYINPEFNKLKFYPVSSVSKDEKEVRKDYGAIIITACVFGIVVCVLLLIFVWGLWR